MYVHKGALYQSEGYAPFAVLMLEQNELFSVYRSEQNGQFYLQIIEDSALISRLILCIKYNVL